MCQVTRWSALLLVAAAWVAQAAPVPAEDVRILENDKKAIYDLKGGTAQVLGNENILTFKNGKKVEVAGNDNRVSCAEGCDLLVVLGNENVISAGRAKTIKVMGNENKVIYKLGPKGEKPQISNLGNKNKISKS